MISAVVLTKNEERNIEDCLKSLSWCDEAVVIDDYSRDETVKKARNLGAKVYECHLNGNFAAQRNFGLEKAQGEWVLFIDADEEVSKKLAREIQKRMKSSSENGFRIKRKTFLWGRELKSSQDRFYPVRLGRKGTGLWKRRVHEIWDVSGEVGTLKNQLLHRPHQTLRQFLREVNFYSTLHAEVLDEEGRRSGIFKIILWPISKFLENWVWHRGFFDGTRGFLVSGMMSFHSFLAWSKLWLRQNKK